MTLKDEQRSHRLWRIAIDAFYILVFLLLVCLILSMAHWSIRFNENPFTYALTGFFPDVFLGRSPVNCLTALLVAIVYLAIIFLANNFWIASGCVWTIGVIFAIGTRIKMLARNEPVLPTDLTTFGSNTGEVMGMMPTNGPRLIIFAVIAILLGIAGCIAADLLLGPGQPLGAIRRTPMRVTAQLVLFVLPALFFASFAYSLGTAGSWAANLAASMGDRPMLFDPKTDSFYNSPLLTFLRNTHTTVMNQPSDYSQKTMQKIASRYRAAARQINTDRAHNITDNTVVMVLSESFADPSRVPGVQLSTDPIPRIKTILSNTSSGLMLSPSYGGGTANIEFQALTGLSTSVFSGSMRTPYQQLVPHWKDAFAFNQLWNQAGGQSIAFHAFDGSFYSRNTDYKRFGFAHFYTENGPEKMTGLNRIGNAPHYSDASSYANVVNNLKSDTSRKQRFIQLATIQNHMPYLTQYYGTPITASSTKYHWKQDEKASVESYAAGISFTDTATKKFLQDLNNLDRPVTVVWYGDHLPGIYASEMGDESNLLTLHLSDYFIWSNKAALRGGEQPRTEGGYTSPNFFMAQEAAHTNSRVTPYLAFLTRAHEQIPALEPQITTATGLDATKADGGITFVNASGRQITRLTKKQQQVLQDYRLITYDLTVGDRYLRKLGFLTALQ